jgi:DNA-binding NarL/FixJ family response regulator
VKATILLVEDEDDTREMLASAIERAGYGCVTARDASEAVERAREILLDVIVTDVVLGSDDRGGLLLIADLRDMGVHAPVLVITAYADVERVKLALNEGATHLLEKPFRAAELVDVIERVRTQRSDVGHRIDQVLSLAHLTDKERAVARYLLDGLSSSEIAEIEHNSPKTIRQHVSQIYAKCNVGSRAEFFRLVYTR